ncbi:MAG: hypothetical protein WC867_02960 [Candidatus Pacearchaeota archaeon]|jgi:hypothetical protein
MTNLIEYITKVNELEEKEAPKLLLKRQSRDKELYLQSYSLVQDSKEIQEIITRYDKRLTIGENYNTRGKNNRLLVEGINTENIIQDIFHQFSNLHKIKYEFSEGNRASYCNKLWAWQGNNGSENVSVVSLDYLIFEKKHFEEAFDNALNNGINKLKCPAQRIIDHGYWEETCYSFGGKNPSRGIQEIELKISLGDNPRFNVDCLKSDVGHIDDLQKRYYVGHEDVVFLPKFLN